MSIYYTDLDLDLPERFDLSKFLEYNEDNFDVLNSSFLIEFMKIKPVGYFNVTYEDKAPDYVSLQLYGKHEYWWLLMYYNNILDFKKLKTGDVLRYFSLSDVESLYFKMKSLEVLRLNTPSTEINVNSTTETSMDKHYVHNQILLSDTWIVNHPLNKRPSVTIIVRNNDGDEEEIGGNVIYPSGFETTRVIITFTTPKRGKVILN